MPPSAMLIGFWPFASAWMLLWGFAAAAPILIHLWTRRQRREVSFAAMEYLLAAIRRHARRIRFEQLLLLIVRILIPLLLALALADPILSLFPSPGGSPIVGGDTHYLLVFDGSYSMTHRGPRKSCFEAAQESATRLVERSVLGDGFTVVLMGETPQLVIREPAFDPADVLEEIAGLQPLQTGAKLSSTLAEIETLLARTEKQHPRLTRHVVCFLTDLGQTTWAEAAEPSCRRRLARLAEKATLTLKDFGHPGAENTAVVRLQPQDKLAAAGRLLSFEANIRHYGQTPPDRRRVQFLMDGQLVREENVQLDERGEATVYMTHRFGSPGEHQIEARTTGDALELDNRRWLSVPVREAVRVLCLGGRQEAAKYLQLALQPGESQTAVIRAEVEPESALLETELNDYDCVAICNVGRFGRTEAARLHAYLEAGGSLIVFLGDLVQSSNYNLELGGELSGKRVLPARIDGLVESSDMTPHALDARGYQHPLTSPFRGHEQSGLLTTPIWTYLKLTPYEPEAAQIALAFQNGDPAIIEQRILNGRSIMVATAASPMSTTETPTGTTPWTALASWPSFVPLAQEMVALAAGGRAEQRNLGVSQPIQRLRHGEPGGDRATVIRPDGREERVELHVDGRISRWVYTDTNVCGIYQAVYDRSVDETELFAVNLDTRESNLARIDPERLPNRLRRDSPAEPLAEAAPPIADQSQLFRVLLGVVLALMLSETLLAWRFGAASV